MAEPEKGVERTKEHHSDAEHGKRGGRGAGHRGTLFYKQPAGRDRGREQSNESEKEEVCNWDKPGETSEDDHEFINF